MVYVIQCCAKHVGLYHPLYQTHKQLPVHLVYRILYIVYLQRHRAVLAAVARLFLYLQETELLERQLAESQRRADEQLAELRARQEQLKAWTTRKEAREARQAAVELRKRQMIIERDQRYREARLQKMRQLRSKMEAEQRLRDEGLLLSEIVQVNIVVVSARIAGGGVGEVEPS